MNAIFFLLLIGPLIFFHELGHFLVAKYFKVKVLRFSIGMGPRIATFTRGETEYCISLLPLGGYVKMLGADASSPSEVDPDEQEGNFALKPLWQRTLIILAGPIANLLLPVAIYLAYYGFAPQFDERLSTVIGTVDQGRPAYEAGMRAGDKIVAIEGTPVRYFAEEVVRTIEGRPSKPTEITVERQGKQLTLNVTPETALKSSPIGQETVGQIGVTPSFLGSAIGITDTNSLAAKAGLQTQDLITTINGKPVTRWLEVEQQLSAVAAGSTVELRYKRGIPLSLPIFSLEVAIPEQTVQLTAPEKPSAEAFGLHASESFVAKVYPNSPAAEAGFQVGDRILGYLPENTAVDATSRCTTENVTDPISIWSFLYRDLTLHPKERRIVAVARPGSSCTLAFTIVPRPQPTDKDSGQAYPDEISQIGMSNLHMTSPGNEMVPVENRLAFAWDEAVYRTVRTTKDITLVFGKLFQGDVPTKSLGGPIMIYKVAGQAADAGWDKFLWTMALISINLGVLNLLPIPLLDGGHLLFFLAEAIRRRPVSLRFREIASFVGLSMILLMMLFAFKNDLERYWPW